MEYIPLCAGSSAHSPAEIVGSNPTGGMDACLLCCQVQVSATELITRPEESYRLWCVVVCDQETSKMRRLKPLPGHGKYNHNGL
jgi:hypothetical protein